MKALATEAASLATTPRTTTFGLRVRRPTHRDARISLLAVTSNYYESRWVAIGLDVAEKGGLLHPWDKERYGKPCTPGRRRV